MSRVPISMETGIRTFFCGPESFTPDLLPVVGEAPELKNYFVAAGMNSVGILTGGGMGRLLAHWILTGRPTSTSPASTSTACIATSRIPSTEPPAPSSHSAWSSSATIPASR